MTINVVMHNTLLYKIMLFILPKSLKLCKPMVKLKPVQLLSKSVNSTIPH